MNYLKIFFLFVLICYSCKQQPKEHQKEIAENVQAGSTYYFIRHAEKDRSSSSQDNPPLTQAGIVRVEKWAELFSDVDFDAVYSTNFIRTRETARPTAEKNNLQITYYDPISMDIEEFLKSTDGQNVLVVGHSDSTPKLVNAIIKLIICIIW